MLQHGGRSDPHTRAAPLRGGNAAEMDERESSDLYRVRKTLCQMLDDRGYVISEEDLTMNLTDFKELFMGDNGKISRERCQITTCKESDSTDQVRGCAPAPRPLAPMTLRSIGRF